MTVLDITEIQKIQKMQTVYIHIVEIPINKGANSFNLTFRK